MSRKEYFKEYRENNKEKIKEYKENNKERISEQRKNHYEKTTLYHPEKIKEYSIVRNLRKKTLITCECGSVITCGHKSEHIKTQKHIKLLKEKNI
jgi:hypothetical protein